MTDQTLARYLGDARVEVRRAAVLGVAAKESKAHTARLVDMLFDPDPGVERASHAALKQLSGEDFGPVLNATEAERERAVTAWRDWWERKKIAS